MPNNLNQSAFMAVDVAIAMGAGRVWLAGIDCYINGVYWYDTRHTIHPNMLSYRAKRHRVRQWENQYKSKPVVACSGPLTEVLNGLY